MKQIGKWIALIAGGLILLVLVGLFGGMQTSGGTSQGTISVAPWESKAPASGISAPSAPTAHSHAHTHDYSYDYDDSDSKSDHSGSTYRPTGGGTTHYYGGDSYSDGYDDLYFGDDYDQDRYDNDPDYAMGVDDAMEDDDW